jgi:hypothetical protein
VSRPVVIEASTHGLWAVVAVLTGERILDGFSSPDEAYHWAVSKGYDLIKSHWRAV